MKSPPFVFIEANGKNASEFLQGQLTSDVNKLNEKEKLFSACCNQQGRVIATLWLTKHKDNYCLVIPENMADILLNHLEKFAPFSKVTLIKIHDKLETNDELANIQKGIPTIYPETSSLFTPHMLNMPKLGAVSFNKGCYLGQEVIARTEHLGKVKRHLHYFTSNTKNPLKPSQAVFDKENQPIGTIVNAMADKEGIYHVLAVIQDGKIS